MNSAKRRAAIAEEVAKLQGTWKQIRYERDGLTDPHDEDGWHPISTITGTTFVVTLADGTVPIAGTFELDPTREPKTIDLSDTIGDDAGKTFPAIYRLEGDRMMMCAGEPGQRPTGFVTRPGQVLRIAIRI